MTLFNTNTHETTKDAAHGYVHDILDIIVELPNKTDTQSQNHNTETQRK